MNIEFNFIDIAPKHNEIVSRGFIVSRLFSVIHRASLLMSDKGSKGSIEQAWTPLGTAHHNNFLFFQVKRGHAANKY